MKPIARERRGQNAIEAPAGEPATRLRALRTLLLVCAAVTVPLPGLCRDAADAPRIALGRALFEDTSLSADGKTACATCHVAAHAYADPRPHSVGVFGRSGTRNAPGLTCIGDDTTFAWDGRRSRLEDVVLDPLTNPVELGLDSAADALRRIDASTRLRGAYRAAYGQDARIAAADVGAALAAFVRSLPCATSAFDAAEHGERALTPLAERGRALFDGVAGCSRCHTLAANPPTLTDGAMHHSGIGAATGSAQLSVLVGAVLAQHLDAAQIGPKVLSDTAWSELGRFVVSHRPADIGAFRTPSLRNVADTAPYMHDGSIATLQQAVDREIYYQSISSGRPVNLTLDERRALVEFLKTLSDAPAETASAPPAEVAVVSP